MRRLSESLAILASTAEDIMRRPVHQLPTSLPQAFSELAAEIRRSHAQPCDGIRATGAGSIMCDAIEGFFRGNPGNDRYQMIIGSTLPLLRSEAFVALNNEKNVAEESRR